MGYLDRQVPFAACDDIVLHALAATEAQGETCIGCDVKGHTHRDLRLGCDGWACDGVCEGEAILRRERTQGTVGEESLVLAYVRLVEVEHDVCARSTAEVHIQEELGELTLHLGRTCAVGSAIDRQCLLRSGL